LFLHEKEMVMVVVARIIGYSLLTAALGALLGLALFGHYTGYGLPTFVLACLGTIVGAVAGAAGEIVTAQRRIADPKPQERMSKSCETWD
jgi:ABC-type xylose transport system permease subunit